MQKLQSHPWHGISPGNKSPEIITAFIEVVPRDSVKFEIDKESGHRKIDRPQKYSSFCPALYGFIPQTYCGPEVSSRANRVNLKGDGDPLDVLVLTEHEITSGSFLAVAKPVGGIRMIDRDEVDDKIISVLQNDALYGSFTEIEQIPELILQKIKHYFLTYKDMPGSDKAKIVEIAEVYPAQEARQVISASMRDYSKLLVDAKIST